MGLGLSSAAAFAWTVYNVAPLWSRHNMEYEVRYGLTAFFLVIWVIAGYVLDGVAGRLGGRFPYYMGICLALALAVLALIATMIFWWNFARAFGP